MQKILVCQSKEILVASIPGIQRQTKSSPPRPPCFQTSREQWTWVIHIMYTCLWERTQYNHGRVGINRATAHYSSALKQLAMVYRKSTCQHVRPQVFIHICILFHPMNNTMAAPPIPHPHPSQSHILCCNSQWHEKYFYRITISVTFGL